MPTWWRRRPPAPPKNDRQDFAAPAALRAGSGSWGRPSLSLLWPPGQSIGRMADALRGPSFIPTVRSAPEWALRLHRVMRRRTLAGYTADQGFTPLPRRPQQA